MSLDISITTYMIAILTDPAVGGTFVNWTIHYLAGDTEYYYAPAQSYIPLIHNPINSINAHGFLPNQPLNVDKFYQMHLLLKHNPSASMYFHHFRDNTETAVSQLDFENNKTILMTLSADDALYQCTYKPRSSRIPSFFNASTINTDVDTIHNDFVDYFFPESKKKWDELNLTDIWDRREFIALNIDPFNVLSMNMLIDPALPHYRLDAVKTMTEFDQQIFELFEYLDLDICKDRLDHWNQVYADWKKLHLDKIRFVKLFDTIVDNIVAGIEFDLQDLKLDIRQEAAIQHQLLFKHNLNLKTWQLDKFTNTLQLHQLLEPNIHHDLSLCNLKKR